MPHLVLCLERMLAEEDSEDSTKTVRVSICLVHFLFYFESILYCLYVYFLLQCLLPIPGVLLHHCILLSVSS